MNKNELVSAVADAAGLSKSDAQSAVEAVFNTITNELVEWRRNSPRRFRNFSVSRREASTGRNPQTALRLRSKRNAEIHCRQAPEGCQLI